MNLRLALLGVLLATACSPSQPAPDAPHLQAQAGGAGGQAGSSSPVVSDAGSSGTAGSGGVSSPPGDVDGAAGGGTTSAAGQPGIPTVDIVPGHGPGNISELGLEAKDRPVQTARFSLYIPDGVAHLAGVIVHQHGCGRDGISVPHDLQWQALANRWGMALMGTQFVTVFPDGDHCDRWSHIENGSGDLFVSALDQFANVTSHAELRSVPWVLWGHSGGATWVFQISKKYPQQTAAIVIKSICEADPAFAPALLQIPTLLATGPQDLGQCYPITTQIFDTYRAAGAPWTYVNEPNGTHDTAQLRLLAIPYLDAVIAARVQGAHPDALNAIAEGSGVLADNTSSVVATASSFAGDARKASWLPSAAVGQAWHEFVTTRTVTDDSAPTQPPTQLSAKRQDNHVTLTWVADADLQSGVRAFKVYRDGSLAMTVPADGKRFQAWNYGDEPDPVMPVQTAVDQTPGQIYRVSLVNGAGIESPQSDAVAAKVQ